MSCARTAPAPPVRGPSPPLAEAGAADPCAAALARCLADCDDLRRTAPDDPGELRQSCRRDCRRAHAARDGGCAAR